MSTEGGVFVRIGDHIVPLVPTVYVAVNEDDIPSEAFAPIRCDSCGAVSVIAAAITYRFYDDDHIGRFEVWYDSRHVGSCAGCGAALEVDLSYTRMGVTHAELREFGLDGSQGKGGKLVSTEGVVIPEEALGGGARGAGDDA